MNAFQDIRWTGRWQGLKTYQQGLDLMLAAWEEVHADPTKCLLLGFEFEPVITLGRRAGDSEVKVGGIPAFHVDRGGLATLHSPGQLVIYPIVHLRERGLGVRPFVEELLATTQSLLASMGVAAHPLEPAGLATPKGKICFLGLRVDRGVTRHGLSLNICNDLALFKSISICGMGESAPLDRLSNWGLSASSVGLFRGWQEHWKLLHPRPQLGSLGAVGSAFP